MKNLYSLAAFISLATSSNLVAANQIEDTDNIEEVHVTGELSRYSAIKSNTPIMETSRSISIETNEQMIEKGVKRLDEALTYSAGVHGEAFGIATRGDWTRVRGLDVPQYHDSLQSLFGSYNNTRAEIYTLEQVEILKGPASVLYGKGSPGGLVNVVSKRPQAESKHEIAFELGSFYHKQLAFDSTGAIANDDTLQYRMVGVYRDAETQIDHVEEQSTVLAPSFTWVPSDSTNITFLVNYTKTESDTAAQFLPLYGTLLPVSNGLSIDSNTYTGEPGFNKYDAETLSLTLLAEHQFNDIWEMEFTSRMTDADVEYQQAWTSFLGGERYNYSNFPGNLIPRSFYASDASSKQLAADIRLRGNFSTGALDHEILIGTQYQDVTTDDDRASVWALGLNPADPTQSDPTYWINPFSPVYGNVPPQSIIDAYWVDNPENNYKDFGFYVSNQMSMGDLKINLGLRYDEIESDEPAVSEKSQNDDAVSGSIGILYESSIGVSPYISYAESFEPVIGDNGNSENPKTLEPQEGTQTELGVKYLLPDQKAYFTFAYFDIEQTNLNDPQALVGVIKQQRGTAEVSGFEFESFVFFGDFNWELNLTKLETEDSNGYKFASVPEEQVSTWLGYRPENGFKGGFGARYVGKSHDGADMNDTPSYTLFDFMAGYEIRNWDFSLNVRNATNKEYYATCLSRGDCFPGKERMIVGHVKYTF